jgi:hypothetical protein
MGRVFAWQFRDRKEVASAPGSLLRDDASHVATAGQAGGLAANAARSVYGLNGRKVGHPNDRRPRSSRSSPWR